MEDGFEFEYERKGEYIVTEVKAEWRLRSKERKNTVTSLFHEVAT